MTNYANATGVPDGTVASLAVGGNFVLDLGSVLPAGTIVTIKYASANTTAPLQVEVSPDNNGYTNVAQVPGNTVGTTYSLYLPFDTEFIRLTTTTTAYTVDAVTYTSYTCVSSPVASCTGAGQQIVSYQKGAAAVTNTSGTITYTANNLKASTGVQNSSWSYLQNNSSITLDLGTLVSAGNTVNIYNGTYQYVAGSSVTAPLQVLASADGVTFVNIAQISPFVHSGPPYNTTSIVTLPINAQYIKLQTNATGYYVDAVTYSTYTCVTSPVVSCTGNQESVSYQTGTQSIGTATGVTTPTNALGVADGTLASMPINTTLTMNFATTVAAGNTVAITYSAADLASPLQLLVSVDGVTYTNIAQLAQSTTLMTSYVTLPVAAKYIKLETTLTAYSVDAATYTSYTCVSNPTTVCGPGQQAVAVNTGAVGTAGTVTGTTSPGNATGSSDGAFAAMAANGILTLDMGSVVPGGTSLSFTYKATNTTTALQVFVSTGNSSGPFISIGQLSPSTTSTTQTLVLPVSAEFVQLQTRTTPFSIDAVTYPQYSCVTSANTSGLVFFDANVNGISNSTEAGIGGVTVKAYDANGNLVATTTSSYGNPGLNTPAGYYVFTNLTAGQPYRLVFSYPERPELEESTYGPDNHGAVQYVLGATQNHDFGMYVPSTLCSYSGDTRLVTGSGLYAGATSSVFSYQYYDRSAIVQQVGATQQSAVPASQTQDLLPNQVGVPLGLASQRGTNLIYMSPISSNLASIFPQAPDGSSAIYIANYNAPDGSQSFQNYKLLMKLSDLGINVGSTSTSLGGNSFGVQGLGGLDFSEDGKTLYVVNMYNGKLVQVDVSGVDYNNLPATKPSNAVELTPPSSLANCSGGVWRPAALRQFGGKIFMGGVCDAEISQSTSDLKGVIVSYDPSTGVWKQELSYPFNFNGGGGIIPPSSAASATFDYGVGGGKSQKSWSSGADVQPVLMDLAFADNGTMVMGVTDRLVYNAATSGGQTGYILGAWKNTDGTYSLENAGKLGPYTTTAAQHAEIASEGPGGKWFFNQSFYYCCHTYTFSGGVFIKAGTNEVVIGAVDPGHTGSFGTEYLSLLNGSPQYGVPQAVGIAKLSRITGAQQVCDATPSIEIGDRVWKDSNGNGIQDPGEPSLAGVTVQLADAQGNVVATAITDADGNYIFSNQPNLTSTSSRLYNLPITATAPYVLSIPSLGTDASTVGVSLTAVTQAPGETAGATNTGLSAINNDAFLVNGIPTIKLNAPGPAITTIPTILGLPPKRPLATLSGTMRMPTGSRMPMSWVYPM
ncbi:hypothetical protein HMF3257_03955 [Spirosoma telluris]|uniref:F5/8 type C domain-containing protein n=1 Tax=Spirosoma telluris TaxID=2183553 RepID=A0A327NG08_9BACT|nr:hypothetical protein HMF3257_03955 [Spirosoma telluris]